jgi:hypothetical protein
VKAFSLIAVAVVGATACAGASAQSSSEAIPAASFAPPTSGFFVGLGGSYNAISVVNPNVYAQGVSNVYQSGTLVAVGAAGGSADIHLDLQSRYAPVLQAGYFEHFVDSKWLWGAKFSYSYLGSSSTKPNLLVPQAGSFTSSTPSTFTGNVLVKSYEVSINHQMILTPFIGRSFERSFVYAGVGPSLSQTQTDLKGVIGFADINGGHTDITGTPTSFSSSQWALGGAAAAGITYFLDRSWFMDMAYSISMTQAPSSNFSGPFSGSTSGYVSTGILSGNYSANVITQSLTVSINKAF